MIEKIREASPMSDHSSAAQDQDLFEDGATRTLLDQLLADSRLYKTSKDYDELLKFVVRLRNSAPFNAVLLQVQKPGLSYAASGRDWRERFGRQPKEAARPLLVLWPFGPVALVYDVTDTEGKPLPEDVASFVSRGPIDDAMVQFSRPLLRKKNIDLVFVDVGDRNAGLIRVIRRAENRDEATQYQININRNHETAVKFTTLTHELGHLLLGHLGPDSRLNVPTRPSLSHAQQELEAESVAYIVCKRNGVEAKSQTYLSNFVAAEMTVNDLDVYQIMRAAGAVESMLKLATGAQFDRPT